MSELPDSWTVLPIGEVNQFTGSTLNPATRPDEVFELYSVPSFPTGNPERLRGSAIGSTKQTVAPGDVLISKINPRINRVWTVGPKGSEVQIASSEWIGFRSGAVQPAFANYYFKSPDFREILCSEVAGVGGSLTRAQPKRVTGYPIPIAPAAEQTRIANQLDTLLTRIQSCNDHLDAIPAMLKRFRQAVLRTAIDGSLTEDWRSETQSRALYAAEQGKSARNAPVSWETVSFESLLADVNKLSYGVLKPDDPVGNSVSMFRVVDIGEWGKRAVTAPSKISVSLANQYLRTKIEEGDVLLSVMATIGRAMVASDSMVGANVNRALAVIKPDHNKVKSQFLLYLLLSPQLIEAFEKASIGSAQLRINLGDLRRFEVALPSLLEQAEIVRRVEALFALVDRIEIRATAARALAQRLSNLTLAKAFRGELVPQDPQDEPASVLLELIASQRTGPAAKKTSKPARQIRAPRAPKEAAAVTKSRQDEDVKGKPYLADHLRRLGAPTTAEVLFRASELPIADFYKQLAWEVAQGHIADGGTTLEARHAAG